MKKKCTQCGKRLDLSKFYKDRNSHKNRCKLCMSVRKEHIEHAEIHENIPYMRINAANKKIEQDTGLILAGVIAIDGYAVPVFLHEYDKEKLASIEAIPIRRIS